MVVGVLEIGLQHVVVDVADRELGAHSRQAHGLELQVGHRAGGVLGQRLVDAHADLAAGFHLAGDEMGARSFWVSYAQAWFPLRSWMAT